MEDLTTTRELAAFIDAAPSPYHAVAETAARLVAAGYREVDRAAAWTDLPDRCFARHGGSLIAWSSPPQAAPETPFVLVGAHTDSPNLRVRARPDVGSAGWRQVGVEVYGGALTNSWLDRDLGLSGRVVVRDGSGTVTHHLLVDRPLLRVAQLAIHLDREITPNGLKLDKQRHLTPLWGVGGVAEGDLAGFVADELGVAADDVVAWDLMTHDLTASALLGRDEELLAAPRLDNLCSAYCGLAALLRSDERDAGSRRVLVLFDHEEIGSTTATGAGSAEIRRVLERIVAASGGGRDELHRALVGGYVVSADMAHATHPNYVERHEPSHQIAVNAGPVIKINANQRYASDAETAARFAVACDRAGVPVQRYVHRNDLPCGSTIGPISAANLGVDVVDVGIAQLSMHSARELCGAHDPELMVAALTEVYAG
ncbi:MAG: M18 family aminopeptidase [Actinomycetota bacterium]